MLTTDAELASPIGGPGNEPTGSCRKLPKPQVEPRGARRIASHRYAPAALGEVTNGARALFAGSDAQKHVQATLRGA